MTHRRFYFSLLMAAAARIAGAQTTSLSGFVRDDQTLRGMAGAEVSVDGVERKVKSEKDGKYVIKDVPLGPRVVHVRMLGFAAIDTVLQFSEGKATENVFFLAKPPVTLDSVVTNATNRTKGPGLESFGDRRAKGFGTFFDSTYLRAHENQHLPDVLGPGVRGINVVRPSTCKAARPIMCDWRVAGTMKAGATESFCAFQVVLDGTVVQRSEQFDDRDAPPYSPQAVIDRYAAEKEVHWGKLFDLNQISVANLAGIEVYRSGAEAPDIYGGSGTNCGVLLLWTRR